MSTAGKKTHPIQTKRAVVHFMSSSIKLAFRSRLSHFVSLRIFLSKPNILQDISVVSPFHHPLNHHSPSLLCHHYLLLNIYSIILISLTITFTSPYFNHTPPPSPPLINKHPLIRSV